jgi:hypothetical protein
MNMSRLFTGSFAAVLVGVAALAAAQTQSRTPVKGANTYDPSKTDVVVGCLRPGTIAGSFVLAEATVTKAGSTEKPVGTSGAAKKSYMLGGIVPPGTDLSKHVNHKVEVAGTVSESADSASVSMHTFKMVNQTCP